MTNLWWYFGEFGVDKSQWILVTLGGWCMELDWRYHAVDLRRDLRVWTIRTVVCCKRNHTSNDEPIKQSCKPPKQIDSKDLFAYQYLNSLTDQLVQLLLETKWCLASTGGVATRLCMSYNRRSIDLMSNWSGCMHACEQWSRSMPLESWRIVLPNTNKSLLVKQLDQQVVIMRQPPQCMSR